MQHIFHHHPHRPVKLRCFGWLAFALLGLAILNVMQSYHASMCDYTAVCDEDLSWLSMMIPMLMTACGTVMCIYQVYRDYLRHDADF